MSARAGQVQQVWHYQTDCLYLRATLHYFGSMVAAAKFASEHGMDDSAIEQTSPRQSADRPGIWRVAIPHNSAGGAA